MDIIKILPVNVANQIAAGEVIQRPSSVVKELLENSLDAGSSSIKLLIKDSGKSLIEVIDNGCGMSENDLKLCFKRHATSKINNLSDIFTIKTMGFRGEAMSSIAAISQIEVKTKLTENDLGSKLDINAGIIKSNNKCATFNGTSIKVKNLFFNVPARRNFLKSDKVEMRHIIEEFTRFSLANPQLIMQLSHNNKEVFYLPKSNFRKRIVNIIGDRKNEGLVPIEEATSIVNINGFIGKPEVAKRTRGEQYFFVNGRFIKDYYLNHAVNQSFKDLIPEKYFASYFINILINPKLIDINIHPTKSEIKFEDDKAIYSIIKSCIKKSLGQYNIAPSLDFSLELSLDLPQNQKIDINEPQIKVDKSYNPFNQSITNQNNYETNKIDNHFDDNISNEDFFKIESLNKNILQISNKYILFINNSDIIILHQRRAHKRIVYESLINKIENKTNDSQKLLFPVDVNLNNIDLDIFLSLKNEFNSLGFIFSNKDNKLIFTGIPCELQERQLQSIVEDIIEKHKNNQELENFSKKNLALLISNSLAISQIKKLEKEEMNELKNKLFDCNESNICPLGKKTMLVISKNDLEKYF